MIHYSLDHLKQDISSITPEASTHAFKTVVGVCRGGILPAATLGYALNCTNILSIVPNRIETLNSFIDFVERDENYLLVDDICDSGVTLHYLTKILEPAMWSKGSRLYTAVLIYNSEQKLHTPDFYGQEIKRSEQPQWYQFFWEDFSPSSK